jgi:type IX secretion system PorP/SprF family membrane protein
MPLYLNPAFTGLTVKHRFAANYRNQWPGASKAFQTYMAAYDHNLAGVSSGVGIFAMQDRAGTGGLTHTQIGGSFAYSFSVKAFSEIRAGINASYNMKTLGVNKLVFNDQFVTGAATSLDAGTYAAKNYLDLSAGLLYNSKQLWFGAVGKHLNQANVSLAGQTEKLPMLIGIHGGYRFILDDKSTSLVNIKKYASIAFNYKHQLKNDQLDLGFYYFNAPINLGVWYRGIPFKKYSAAYSNNESLAFLVGFEVPNRNIRIGYSFDLTISNLGLSNSKGAHEVSLVYEFGTPDKSGRRIIKTNPKF